MPKLARPRYCRSMQHGYRPAGLGHSIRQRYFGRLGLAPSGKACAGEARATQFVRFR